jgi:hypothetical protein
MGQDDTNFGQGLPGKYPVALSQLEYDTFVANKTAPCLEFPPFPSGPLFP